MHALAAASPASTGGLWPYLAIFVLVAIGWAGVPAIGGTVVAGAAVLASQGQLAIGAVLVVSVLGTEAGGLRRLRHRPPVGPRDHGPARPYAGPAAAGGRHR